ncbi:MAG: transcriptional repressor [Bacteroidia bacterium]|nr:transcriptional repressor [Bacteroidia bacterium]
MANKTVIRILAESGLKITPQRTAVLEVILSLNNHPTADNIAEYLRMSYPHIPIGTVYKILDTFFEKGIIKKVKTGDDVMRYDGVQKKHYHLLCADSERIEDYYDDELNKILNEYFGKKRIPGFIIEDFKVQIVGQFKDKNKKK